MRDISVFTLTPADLAPIGSQKPAQHPRPGEGELHVQTVDLAHQLEVGRRYRARQVTTAMTTLRFIGAACVALSAAYVAAFSLDSARR